MALRSLTEEELERARNARQLNTVLKSRSGKLLRREKAYAETLAEIEASPAPDPFSDCAEYLHELRITKRFSIVPGSHALAGIASPSR